MLEAKSVMYGRDFRVIDRWIPTSQTCSCCGFKGGKKELNVREWICLNCGTFHDRDINAAINILVAGGLSETLNGRGGRRKTTAKVAVASEASTYPAFEQLSPELVEGLICLNRWNPRAFTPGRMSKSRIQIN